MRGILFTTALALSLTSPASAAIMSFDNLPGEYASRFTTYTENGFRLTELSGFSNKASIGEPSAPAVVSYGFNIVFELVAVGGGTFTFEGFGLFVPTNNATAYQVTGSRGGTSVLSFGNTIGGTSSRFVQQQSNSAAVVDRITMTFNNYGSPQGSSTFDSVGSTLTAGGTPPGGSPVPEPTSWGMMTAGFGLMGSALRSRRRSTLAAIG